MDNDKMPEPVMWLHEQTGEILGNPWNPDDPLEQCKDPPVPLYSAETVQALQAEANEQARLNGMGAEREARLMARVTELQSELDALRKDAARYRWLCDGGIYRVGFDSIGNVSLDMLDATIDATMAEGER